MSKTATMPESVIKWLRAKFPTVTPSIDDKGPRSHILVSVCPNAKSDEIERICDIANGDFQNKRPNNEPFYADNIWPLHTRDNFCNESDAEEPEFVLIQVGATFKLAFIDIDDDNPHTLRVITYAKFKGLFTKTVPKKVK